MIRNFEKLRELILSIAQQSAVDPALSNERLTALLFRADFEQFRRTGEAVTGGDYIKMPDGPVLDQLDGILDGMQGQGELRIEREGEGAGERMRPVALREPDMGRFTADEIALVDDLIREYRGMTVQEASDHSGAFIGWRVARPGERIPYGTAWLSAPPPTDDDRRIVEEIAAQLERR